MRSIEFTYEKPIVKNIRCGHENILDYMYLPFNNACNDTNMTAIDALLKIIYPYNEGTAGNFAFEQHRNSEFHLVFLNEWMIHSFLMSVGHSQKVCFDLFKQNTDDKVYMRHVVETMTDKELEIGTQGIWFGWIRSSQENEIRRSKVFRQCFESGLFTSFTTYNPKQSSAQKIEHRYVKDMVRLYSKIILGEHEHVAGQMTYVTEKIVDTAMLYCYLDRNREDKTPLDRYMKKYPYLRESLERWYDDYHIEPTWCKNQREWKRVCVTPETFCHKQMSERLYFMSKQDV